MREAFLVALAVCACKPHAHATRHIALPPGPAPVLDPTLEVTPPSTPPRIAASSWGGEPAMTSWSVALWADGTIITFGYKCAMRRLTLPPTRVSELADALKQLDLDDLPGPKNCDEGAMIMPETVSISVDGAKAAHSECQDAEVEIDNALDLIRTAVSTVPCDQNFLK